MTDPVSFALDSANTSTGHIDNLRFERVTRDRKVFAQQDVPGQSGLFDPLGVLDHLGNVLAVPLVHYLQVPACLPERPGDGVCAEAAV
jgi:hypothetical protein